MSVETASAVVWGDTVVEATYAGHAGLVYEPRPRSLVALLDESARFGERTFLVQGEQRVTFAQFRRAAVAAAGVLQGHGVGSRRPRADLGLQLAGLGARHVGVLGRRSGPGAGEPVVER